MSGRWRVLALCLLCILGVRAMADAPAGTAAVLPEGTRIYHLATFDPIFGYSVCYLLAGPTGQAIAIDPADQLALLNETITVTQPNGERTTYDRYRTTGIYAPQILQALTERKLTLKYIILTHGHMDHIGSAAYLKQHTGAQILMHEGDVREGSPKDAYRIDGAMTTVDRTVKEGELITLDGMGLQVLHTPGHSRGGICLLTRQGDRTIVFTGDTLLYHCMGRSNFLDGSGDEALLCRMIRERLFTLPDDTLVLSAHMADEYGRLTGTHYATTIGEEKQQNFFRDQILGQPTPPADAGETEAP